MIKRNTIAFEKIKHVFVEEETFANHHLLSRSDLKKVQQPAASRRRSQMAITPLP